jgi:hypothetical protein
MDDDQDWPTAGLADAAGIASEAYRKIFEAGEIESGHASLLEARTIVDRVHTDPVVSIDFAGHAAGTLTRYAMERLTETGATPKAIGVTACMIRPHAESGERTVEMNLHDDHINGRAIGLFASAALAESLLHRGTARGGTWLRRAREADSRMAHLDTEQRKDNRQQLTAARNMLNRFDGRRQPPFRTWQEIGHAGLAVLAEPPDLEKYARP